MFYREVVNWLKISMGIGLLGKLGAALVQSMMVRACLGNVGLTELSPHQMVVMYIGTCMYDI